MKMFGIWGLEMAAKALALERADATLGETGRWYGGPFRKEWAICSRMHARNFPTCPTAQYYRIMDNIAAGREP